MSPEVVRKAVLAVLTFSSAFAIAASMANAPMPSEVRTGVRGLARQRVLAKGGAWCQLEPLVRWLGNGVRGLVGARLLRAVDRQLALAGGVLGLLPEEFVALSVVGAAVGLAMGALANGVLAMGPMFVVAIGAFGAVAPLLAISSYGAERAKAIGRRLPNAVDLIALAMSAGRDFPGAVQQVVEKSGTPEDPLIVELTLVLQSLHLGRTRRQALEELAERVPLEVVKEFVGAVVQAELRGNPLSEVLQIQAEVSRQRRTVRAEEAAAKAGVALVVPLVLVFVTILILIAGPMAIRLQQNGFG